MSKRDDRVFSPSEAKGGCAVDQAKTAVVFIEYQNEFTTEGGKMHDAVKVRHRDASKTAVKLHLSLSSCNQTDTALTPP